MREGNGRTVTEGRDGDARSRFKGRASSPLRVAETRATPPPLSPPARFNLYPLAARFLSAARTSFGIAPLRPLPGCPSPSVSPSPSMKYDDDSIATILGGWTGDGQINRVAKWTGWCYSGRRHASASVKTPWRSRGDDALKGTELMDKRARELADRRNVSRSFPEESPRGK